MGKSPKVEWGFPYSRSYLLYHLTAERCMPSPLLFIFEKQPARQRSLEASIARLDYGGVVKCVQDEQEALWTARSHPPDVILARAGAHHQNHRAASELSKQLSAPLILITNGRGQVQSQEGYPLQINLPSPVRAGQLRTALDFAVQNSQLARQNLEESARQAALFEHNPLALLRTSWPDLDILEANPAFFKLWGGSIDDLKGCKLDCILSLHGALIEKIVSSVEQGSSPWRGTCELKAGSGAAIPVEGQMWCSPSNNTAIYLSFQALKGNQDHPTETKVMAEITASLSGPLEPDQILERIISHIKRVVPYDAIAILLRQEDRLTTGALRGIEHFTREVNLNRLPIVQQVLETKTAAIVSDLKTTVLRREGGWLVVPMFVNEHAVGVLVLHTSAPQSYCSCDAQSALAFASSAAVALENAWLHERAQRSLQRLSALRKIDNAISASRDLAFTLDILLNQVITHLNVDAADILLFNSNNLALDFGAGRGFHTKVLQNTHIRLGEGFAGQAALQRKPLMIENLAAAHSPFPHTFLTEKEGFSAYYAAPLMAKGQLKGVLEIFHRSPLRTDPDWHDFVEALSLAGAIAIDNFELFENLQQSNIELMLAYDTTLAGWAKALELRNRENGDHTRRLTELTEFLALEVGIRGEDLAHIRRGAILHDIGKMGVPDRILRKEAPLDESEWEVMRMHPVYAYQWLSPIAYLRPALDIPYCHHERWDGSGYPRGLKGEEIPLAARIFAVVDVWDALCSDRPYQKAWKINDVIDYIRSGSGTHFDPKIVEVFLKILPDWLSISHGD
jgi:HD-GYP domain-containing protein (c-di-GMP phosphodiesterase class II)/AmiR/NasT family two-component response regulator